MSILSDTPVLFGPRAFGLIIGFAVLLMAGGCAKQQNAPGYYDPPPGSSAADATSQARNTHNRSVVSAPSQIQFDLKSNAPDDPSDAAPTGHAAFIAQPQTYLGTLPCFHRELQCTAQRITLTLAPNGRWRVRAGYLHTVGHSRADLVDQGCWHAIPEHQPRIMLIERNGNVRAELVMTQSNALRVRTINGEGLSLAYRLTRQPDLDPIDELSGTPAPACD